MRRIDAHRHPRQAPDHRDVREIDHVPVRGSPMISHPAQAEHTLCPPRLRGTLGGVERPSLRVILNPKLEQHREACLSHETALALEVLGAARPDSEQFSGIASLPGISAIPSMAPRG
jgi:hypothetical protein